jgi:hypothetical protein
MGRPKHVGGRAPAGSAGREWTNPTSRYVRAHGVAVGERSTVGVSSTGGALEGSGDGARRRRLADSGDCDSPAAGPLVAPSAVALRDVARAMTHRVAPRALERGWPGRCAVVVPGMARGVIQYRGRRASCPARGGARLAVAVIVHGVPVVVGRLGPVEVGGHPATVTAPGAEVPPHGVAVGDGSTAVVSSVAGALEGSGDGVGSAAVSLVGSARGGAVAGSWAVLEGRTGSGRTTTLGAVRGAVRTGAGDGAAAGVSVGAMVGGATGAKGSPGTCGTGTVASRTTHAAMGAPAMVARIAPRSSWRRSPSRLAIRVRRPGRSGGMDRVTPAPVPVHP